MKKKQIGTAGLIAAVAFVYAGLSWQAGMHIEGQSKAAAQSINVSLARSWSEQVQLSLRSYDRGIFSSRAVYALTLTNQSKQAEQREILWSNQIQHGPFPWSRLQTGDLSVSGAVIQTTVMKNPTTEALFDATGGRSPVTGTTHISREGIATLRWTILPFDYTQDSLRIKLGTAELSARIGPSFSFFKSNSSLDGVTLSDGKLAFEVKGLQLTTDTQATKAGVQTGTRDLRIGTLSWASLDASSLGLQKFSLHTDLREANGLLGGITTAEASTLKLNEKVWGEFNLSLGYEKLNGSALRALLDFQDGYLLRKFLGLAPSESAAAADTKKLWQHIAVLSKTSPTLSLSPLSWKNSQGRSQLALSFTLNPSEPNSGGIGLQGAPLKELDATLSLSTPMLNAVYAQALQTPGANTTQVKNKAEQEVRKLLEQASQLKLGRAQNNKLVAHLNIQDGDFRLNGQRTPSEPLMKWLRTTLPSGWLAERSSAVQESPDENVSIKHLDPAVLTGLLSASDFTYDEIKDKDGDRVLKIGTAETGAEKIEFIFVGCGDDRTCEDVLMRATFPKNPHVALNAINEWNQRNRWARAFLNDAEQAVLEMDISAYGGIERDALETMVDNFFKLLREFSKSLSAERK
jgi:uncharacterized protein YdgA (DUF945 family)